MTQFTHICKIGSQDLQLSVAGHFTKTRFLETSALFLVNVLIITFKLGNPISGALLMIGSIILVTTGLFEVGEMKERGGFTTLLDDVLMLCFAVVIGEIGFIGSRVFLPEEYMGWVFFFVCFMLGAQVSKFFKRKAHRVIQEARPGKPVHSVPPAQKATIRKLLHYVFLN
jgi:hypothetical protein